MTADTPFHNPNFLHSTILHKIRVEDIQYEMDWNFIVDSIYLVSSVVHVNMFMSADKFPSVKFK